MSPVLSLTGTKLEGTRVIYVDPRDEVSSSGTSSHTHIELFSPSPTISTATLASSNDLLLLPEPTQPLKINEKDTGYAYVTLSITLPYTTYASIVLLGDSFPTTNTLIPTTFAIPTSQNVKLQTPGTATGTIVGIVIGLIVGFGALIAVFYVYLLRARQVRRRRRRRRSRRGSSATADGAWFWRVRREGGKREF